MLIGTDKACEDSMQSEIVSDDIQVNELNYLFASWDYFTEGKYQAAISNIERFFKSIQFPESRIYIYEHLLYYLCLYLDGQTDIAEQHILDYSKALDDAWVAPVVHFYANKISEDSLLQLAGDPIQQMEKEQECDAYYYAGMKHLLEGDTIKAKARFEACIATGISYYPEYDLAKIELDRLSQPTDVKEILNTSIESYELMHNYPNPFDPETTIEYELPQAGSVR